MKGKYEMPVFTEELEEAAVVLTKTMWTFFESCVERGFTREEALLLTIDFMRCGFASQSRND